MSRPHGTLRHVSSDGIDRSPCMSCRTMKLRHLASDDRKREPSRIRYAYPRLSVAPGWALPFPHKSSTNDFPERHRFACVATATPGLGSKVRYLDAMTSSACSALRSFPDSWIENQENLNRLDSRILTLPVLETERCSHAFRDSVLVRCLCPTMKLRHPAGDIRTQWSSRKRCVSSGLSVAPG